MTAIPPNPSPRSSHPALAGFHEPVRAWFSHSFEAPTRAQQLAWPVIAAGENALVLAPTGSGKTLAAFLAAIDGLMFEPVPDRRSRCRVLYISPLKALAVDVERNLRAPIVGVTRYAERMDFPASTPDVAIRTGDTPARDRARFNRDPADILITTPESLFLLLTSSAREVLRSVRTVIVDEVHAMVNTKRGAHLSLSLERLQALVPWPLQRIGLSATVQPVDEAARFLGGFCASAPVAATSPALAHASPRAVTVVDAGRSKTLDLRVEVAVEDMARLGEVIDIPSGPTAAGERRTSIWPAIHPLVLDLIRRHRSTLIFVNSRRLAERMAAALNELAGEELVRAHHGSIAREQRLRIEDELKSGRLPAMVATSSLELGIDMGAIDLVIQIESPPSVSSGIQRIGRAGHQIDTPSKGIILPKYRGDLLACAALTERMLTGAVEPMRYARNPLDVLAQQIVGMVSMEDWSVEELSRVIGGAAPFAELPPSMMVEVLDMLSGRYPSDDFAELRPRLTWDRLAGTLRSREGAKRIALSNSGSIPDRGLYGVFLAGEPGGASAASRRVGELDEEMVFECRIGDVFLLGASSWRIEEITHDRVLVTPAPGEPGRMPFWKGESVGRSLEFGRAIGALSRTLRELPRDAGVRLLMDTHALAEGAAVNLLQYLDDQFEAIGVVPDDRTLVVERYMDEMGDWRVCLLSPFGGKLHAPWAMAISAMAREKSDFDVDLLWSDDGIVVRFPEADEPPPIEAVIPDPEDVEDLVVRSLGSSALFAARFREAAGRALLLPRRYPGQRTPLWQLRRRSSDLLKAASQYPSFPILLEAYRECLSDVFDMPALVSLLREIRGRAIRVVAVNSRTPSPFASSLLFNYVANFVYEGDAPLAELRAQALSVDQNQLRELLGEVALRELLDPDALEELELQLQHLTDERKARHADGLNDLLLRLGDLSPDEIRARCAGTEESTSQWVRELERARRIVLLTVAGEARYVAGEDTGRYRDALGIPPPPGLPDAFLEYVRDPLGELVIRYARTHGPFHAQEIADRFGLGVGPVQRVLGFLEAAGRVVQGEFRPTPRGGSGAREWCDAGVLRVLRQRSLARLRREVEPVEQSVLGRLYLGWQNIASRRRGREALIEVIEQLQGAAVPASDLESRILRARLESYEPRDLDELTTSGAVLWVGLEPLGEHDGRIALYLAEHAHLLHTPAAGAVTGTYHDAIRRHLAERGASFFPQLLQACSGSESHSAGGAAQQVLDALWGLVWAGEVTNDSLQPLRAFLDPRRRLARRASGPRGLRGRSILPAHASGRWSLVSSVVFGDATPTRRTAARTRQLLDRHGVLTREAVHAEGVAGGFSTVYAVLKPMEEAGQVRRGYFVSGLGATQFALPGAVDRLRALREPADDPVTLILAATDPANPYGAALPWPGSSRAPQELEDAAAPSGEPPRARRAARAAGAVVVLVDGALAAWMGRAERSVTTYLDNVPERRPDEVAHEIALALAGQVTSGRRRAVFVKDVDGKPAPESAMKEALVAAGFSFGPHGYMKRA